MINNNMGKITASLAIAMSSIAYAQSYSNEYNDHDMLIGNILPNMHDSKKFGYKFALQVFGGASVARNVSINNYNYVIGVALSAPQLFVGNSPLQFGLHIEGSYSAPLIYVGRGLGPDGFPEAIKNSINLSDENLAKFSKSAEYKKKKSKSPAVKGAAAKLSTLKKAEKTDKKDKKVKGAIYESEHIYIPNASWNAAALLKFSFAKESLAMHVGLGANFALANVDIVTNNQYQEQGGHNIRIFDTVAYKDTIQVRGKKIKDKDIMFFAKSAGDKKSLDHNIVYSKKAPSNISKEIFAMQLFDNIAKNASGTEDTVSIKKMSNILDSANQSALYLNIGPKVSWGLELIGRSATFGISAYYHNSWFRRVIRDASLDRQVISHVIFDYIGHHIGGVKQYSTIQPKSVEVEEIYTQYIATKKDFEYISKHTKIDFKDRKVHGLFIDLNKNSKKNRLELKGKSDSKGYLFFRGSHNQYADVAKSTFINAREVSNSISNASYDITKAKLSWDKAVIQKKFKSLDLKKVFQAIDAVSASITQNVPLTHTFGVNINLGLSI